MAKLRKKRRTARPSKPWPVTAKTITFTSTGENQTDARSSAATTRSTRNAPPRVPRRVKITSKLSPIRWTARRTAHLAVFAQLVPSSMWAAMPRASTPTNVLATTMANTICPVKPSLSIATNGTFKENAEMTAPSPTAFLSLNSFCNAGTWTCTKKHCSKTCSVIGTNHIQTFDGKTYDVRGTCDYVFLEVSGFISFTDRPTYIEPRRKSFPKLAFTCPSPVARSCPSTTKN